MRFSIIIPTLNEERFVGLLLKDLTLQQGHDDFEVIHVDADSEDKTCEMVHSFSQKLPIRTIVSPKRNLSFQRNLGAEHATGQYLIFIDADTRIPDKLFLKSVATEIKKSHYLIYLPKVTIAEMYKTLSVLWSFYCKSIEVSQYFSTPLPSPGLAIFERHFFTHIGGYTISAKHDEKKLFLEDQEILVRAKKMGVSGRVIHSTHYMYSLRRAQREGWLQSIPRLMTTLIDQSFGRSVIETEYEMGGHLYKQMKN